MRNIISPSSIVLILLGILFGTSSTKCFAINQQSNNNNKNHDNSDPPNAMYVLEKDIPAYTLYNQAVYLNNHPDKTSHLQAIEVYRKALNLKPDLGEALINLGTLYDKIGEQELAIKCFNDILSFNGVSPNIKAGAANNLGHMSSKNKGKNPLQDGSSIKWYQIALSHNPNHVDALYNLGLLLQNSGGGGELQARGLYVRVLELEAEHEFARMNLANSFFASGDDWGALRHYEVVLSNNKKKGDEILPNKDLDYGDDELIGGGKSPLVMTLNNIGQVYRNLNLHCRAEKAFDRAFRLSDFGDPNSRVNRFVARRTLMMWQEVDDVIWGIVGAITRELSPSTDRGRQRDDTPPSLLPYDSTLLSQISPSLRKRISQSTSRPYEGIDRFGAASRSSFERRRSLHDDGRLTIAYLSYDFRDHPMGHLVKGLITGHDRTRFKTIALSYGEDDGSAHRRAFEGGVDLFIEACTEQRVGGDGDKSSSLAINATDAGRQLHDLSTDICIDLSKCNK
jgi:tetratricopeptide (TPR) repeat protein